MQDIIPILQSFGLFILLNCLPPFVIGVILKGILKNRNISEYIPIIISVAILLISFLIYGHAPIKILESNIIGSIILVFLYVLFINSGIRTYSEFMKALKS